jgi:hypothetical protein
MSPKIVYARASARRLSLLSSEGKDPAALMGGGHPSRCKLVFVFDHRIISRNTTLNLFRFFLLVCYIASRICMLTYDASLLGTPSQEPTGGKEFVWAAPNAPLLCAPACAKPVRICHHHDTRHLVTLPKGLHIGKHLVARELHHALSERSARMIARREWPSRAPPFA